MLKAAEGVMFTGYHHSVQVAEREAMIGELDDEVSIVLYPLE